MQKISLAQKFFQNAKNAETFVLHSHGPHTYTDSFNRNRLILDTELIHFTEMLKHEHRQAKTPQIV